jgi:uncharacterized membrane protein (UPF0127 family)
VLKRLFASFLLLLLFAGGVAAQTGQPQSLATAPLTIETQGGRQFHFTVQLATTSQEQTIGLMFVESMPADAGMLFVFPDVAMHNFWMRNTLIPLDMLFIGPDGKIVNIIERAEPLTLDPRPSAAPVKYVLELNGGITRFLSIHPGDTVIVPPGL